VAEEALASKGAGGAQCKLAPAQVAELEAVRDAAPAACGYEDQRWPLARVAEQAWRRFGAEYTLAGMDVLLHLIRNTFRLTSAARPRRPQA
jgi:hypothetical protein